MRQQQFESAVARATGESLRTIQCRGFSLVRPDCGNRSNSGRKRGSHQSRMQSHSDRLDEYDLSEDTEI